VGGLGEQGKRKEKTTTTNRRKEVRRK